MANDYQAKFETQIAVFRFHKATRYYEGTLPRVSTSQSEGAAGRIRLAK